MDILTCRCQKSTVTDKKVLILTMVGLLGHLNRTESLLMLFVTSQNVCCKKKKPYKFWVILLCSFPFKDVDTERVKIHLSIDSQSMNRSKKCTPLSAPIGGDSILMHSCCERCFPAVDLCHIWYKLLLLFEYV